MDELLRAKQDIEAEIEAVKAVDNTAAINEAVDKYRAEITAQYAKDKADKLIELEVGLRYINRAIERESTKTVEAIPTEEVV
jgi:hypothetical protein